MFLFSPQHALKEQEKSAEDINRQILDASIELNKKLSELAVVKDQLAAAKVASDEELKGYLEAHTSKKASLNSELVSLQNSMKDIRKEKETWDVDLKAREQELVREKQEIETKLLSLAGKEAQYDEKLEKIVALETEIEQKLFDANVKEEKSEKERVRVAKMTKELTKKLSEFLANVAKEETRLKNLQSEASQTLLNASLKLKEVEVRESIVRDKEKLVQSQMAATQDAYRRITQHGKRSA